MHATDTVEHDVLLLSSLQRPEQLHEEVRECSLLLVVRLLNDERLNVLLKTVSFERVGIDKTCAVHVQGAAVVASQILGR